MRAKRRKSYLTTLVRPRVLPPPEPARRLLVVPQIDLAQYEVFFTAGALPVSQPMNDGPTSGEPPEQSGPQDPKSAGPLIYSVHELFQGRREIWIEHGEQMYRLRITGANKLYLTK